MSTVSAPTFKPISIPAPVDTVLRLVVGRLLKSMSLHLLSPFLLYVLSKILFAEKPPVAIIIDLFACILNPFPYLSLHSTIFTLSEPSFLILIAEVLVNILILSSFEILLR